jgi:signal transduction histidine kinase
MLRRIPLRLRLTVAFAAALLIVLALSAAFVYARVEDDLNENLDENLSARADAAQALVEAQAGRPGGTGFDRVQLGEGEDGFAQVLRQNGEVVASTLPATAGSVLDPAELGRASEAASDLGEREVAGVEAEARILARPLRFGDRTYIVVVGASTGDRDETLAGLRTTFLIGAPVAVLLISALGYLLAGLAVAPIAAALRHERTFVGDASHELRTPLSVLRTELELAQRRERSPQELAAVLRSAAEEVDRLSRLAEDLLVLARSDERSLPLKRDRIRLADLLERVRRRFGPRAEQAGRELMISAPDGAEALLDPVRLEQALGNLVDNALRYGAGPVRLEAARANGFVALAVRDDGDGFPPDYMPRAFERFSRADDARSGAGAGLGLALVDAVARAHGGRAFARNGGAGTRIGLVVPR